MTDEPRTLICAPVDSSFEVIPGSVVHHASCGHDVWLAPTGQEMVADVAEVVCVPCGLRMVQADPSPEFVPPTAEQLREIRDFYG